MLRTSLLALAVSLGFAGCYRSSPPPPPPVQPRDPPPATTARSHAPPRPPRSAMAEVFDKMRQLTDEMCACTDKTCADAVTAELNTWAMEMSKEYADAPKPDEEDTKEMTAIAERLGKCMMAAMTPPPPPTP